MVNITSGVFDKLEMEGQFEHNAVGHIAHSQKNKKYWRCNWSDTFSKGATLYHIHP